MIHPLPQTMHPILNTVNLGKGRGFLQHPNIHIALPQYGSIQCSFPQIACQFLLVIRKPNRSMNLMMFRT